MTLSGGSHVREGGLKYSDGPPHVDLEFLFRLVYVDGL